MVDIEKYISDLLTHLKIRFGDRLAYVGLQGSYLRDEATEHSDIDIMVVIDLLSVSDLDAYKEVISLLPYSERSCGFICSKGDLANWNPLEICHLLHSTRDYYGTLSSLLPAYDRQDILNFVKLSINNLYHEICHRYIHASIDKSAAKLPYSYRSVFFILQNLHYLEAGEFLPTKAALLQALSGQNREILETSILLSKGLPYDFEQAFALLFAWCQNLLKHL